jgi:hypothetical protein
MAAQLKIYVTVKNNTITTGEKLEIIADITAKTIDIENASVSVSCAEGGTFNPATGTSDINGVFRTIFVPDTSITGTYNIVFTASKQSLTTGTKTIQVVVQEPPTNYTDRNKEMLTGVKRIRQDILDTLKLELDSDPDLYPSTGATQGPIYINGFSYTTRDFPQLVITGSGIVPRRVSIGDHRIGDYYGTSNYKDRGGWHDLSLSLVAIAEDKSTQELLLDKAISTLWSKQQWNLLKKNIVIFGISAGSETQEPYGSRLLYAASIDISMATQWFLRDEYDKEISQLNYEQTIQS